MENLSLLFESVMKVAGSGGIVGLIGAAVLLVVGLGFIIGFAIDKNNKEFKKNLEKANKKLLKDLPDQNGNIDNTDKVGDDFLND